MPFSQSGIARSKPMAGCSINWGHPLMRGVRALVLFTEGAGSATFDYCPNQQTGGNNLTAYTFTGSNITWTSTKDGGYGADISGTSYLTGPAVMSDSGFLGPITLLWRGTVRTGSALNAFLNKHAGTGAFQCPFDFGTDASANPKPRLVRASGTFGDSHREWTGPTALALKQVTTVAVEHAGTGIESPLPNFYVNGRFGAGTLTGGASTGAPTGSSAPITIGRRADGGRQLDGIVEYAIVWNRILSADDHKALWDAPYDFINYEPVWRRARIDVFYVSWSSAFNLVSSSDPPPQFNSAAVFASSFQAQTSFATLQAAVGKSDFNFKSEFTVCRDSSLANTARGGGNRYRR